MRLLISRMTATSQCPPRKPMRKILWSLLGSFLGIYLVAMIGKSIQFDPLTNLFLIGSFGATAVLIYGAPLAEFSQPRNLIGGHVFSAIVGVTVAKFLSADLMLACALAVSVSIAVMHLTRTLHPPGGATALIAVIGGDSIQQLGYYYVISPVLLGASIMLLVGLLVNNLSRNPKRHYPVYWW
ncbi:HPP family protein [Pseudoalteromonas prydzensis]|uniref:HPP family protein n=1 Tax=Pseudoalteromonas prydzensis TaxID=182141 RepID=UPI0024BC11F4|nr:HPP family protein [Pseudoalteromonas prydzensis]|eukprot:TRINITY_DN4072_c0_g3_i1.p1 TRINITY_DN4072_c0_g3~~TRINITY_DN4072_c0_g3_i1.p1  ORF type:complete len:183 (+),score=24.60 TRINITY_DN4072_c0_g3_i1:128-676(+)